jgi:hypothetical protein
MRRRSHILGAIALLVAAMGFACSLNPQPYPPGTAFTPDDSGAADSGGTPSDDASFGDAGGGADASPPPKEAGVDASSDAGSDGATDGGDAGDADAPTDAALAEGG